MIDQSVLMPQFGYMYSNWKVLMKKLEERILLQVGCMKKGGYKPLLSKKKRIELRR